MLRPVGARGLWRVGMGALDSASPLPNAMPSYNVYHVVPRDGRWVARLQGSPSISADGDRRESVVDQAESIIRQLGAGRIVVHGADGAIESVHTYDQILAERDSGWAETLLSTPVLLGMAAACLVGVGFALRGRR